MPRRGPIPRPTTLTLLAGETRPSRVNRSEPQPRSAEPTAPDWLSAEARRAWDEAADELKAMGLFNADTGTLTAYAIVEEVVRKTYSLATGAIVCDADGVPQRNWAWPVLRDALQATRLLAAELGLTPSARSRLSVPPPEGEVDPRERLLS